MSDVTTDPVVEEPTADVSTEVETTTYDWADEGIQTRAREAIERSEKWGDPTGVDQALEIQKALQTDEGVTQLFIQAGKALGIGLDKIDALFGSGAPAPEPVDTSPGWEPDHIPTGAEIQEYMTKELDRRMAQATQQTSQQLQASQAEAVARTTVTNVMTELGVTDPDEAKAVLALADAHIRQGDMDPTHISAAVRRGYAQYEKNVATRVKAYMEKKRTQTDTLPGSTSGGAPGGEDLPEPKTVAEARDRARKRGLFGRA